MITAEQEQSIAATIEAAERRGYDRGWNDCRAAVADTQSRLEKAINDAQVAADRADAADSDRYTFAAGRCHYALIDLLDALDAAGVAGGP